MKCVICNKEKHKKSVGEFCRDCWINITKFKSYRNFLSKTIKDVSIPLRQFRETTEVRRIAREIWNKLNYPNFCEICGYNKHYEICHIKPIRDFDENDKISSVNNPANMIALCPNCHWEFDNMKMSDDNNKKVFEIVNKRIKRYL